MAINPTPAPTAPLEPDYTRTDQLNQQSATAAGEALNRSTSVADNITGLLEKNSPYLQQAATFARQQANKRGLLNSSIAIGNTEAARIQAALPIASQDAQSATTFQNTQQQQYGQQALQEAGYQQQTGLLGKQQEFQSTEAQKERTFTAAESAENRLLQKFLNKEQLTAAEEQQLRDIESREGMQASEFAQQRGLQAAEQQFQLTAQQTEIAARMGLSAQEYTQKKDLQTQSEAFQKDITEIQIGSAERLSDKDIAARLGLSAQEFRQRMVEAEQSHQFRVQEMEVDYDNKSELLGQEYINNRGLKELERDNALALLDSEYDLKDVFSEAELDRRLEEATGLNEVQKDFLREEWGLRKELAQQEADATFERLSMEYDRRDAQQAADWVQRGLLSGQEAQQAMELQDRDYANRDELSNADLYRQMQKDNNLNRNQIAFLWEQNASQRDLQSQEFALQYQNQSALQSEEWDRREETMISEYAQRAGLQADEAEAALNYMKAEYANRSEMSLQEFEQTILRDENLTQEQKDLALFQHENIEIPRMREETDLKMEMMAAEAGYNVLLEDVRSDNEFILQELRGLQSMEQAERVAAIEADYKMLMQTSATAGDLIKDAQTRMAEILGNKDIKAEDKNTAVARILDLMESGLEVTGLLGNVDINSVLNYGTGGQSPAPSGTSPAPVPTATSGSGWFGMGGGGGGDTSAGETPAIGATMNDPNNSERTLRWNGTSWVPMN